MVEIPDFDGNEHRPFPKWRIDPKIILTVFLFIIVQVSALMWQASAMSTTVTRNTSDLRDIKDQHLPEQIVELKTEFKNIKEQLDRIEQNTKH